LSPRLLAAKKFSEKKSMFKSQYGKNVILKSNGGHFIEMDDSDDGERINIQHKNGTFITLMPDRTIVMRATKWHSAGNI